MKKNQVQIQNHTDYWWGSCPKVRAEMKRLEAEAAARPPIRLKDVNEQQAITNITPAIGDEVTVLVGFPRRQKGTVRGIVEAITDSHLKVVLRSNEARMNVILDPEGSKTVAGRPIYVLTKDITDAGKNPTEEEEAEYRGHDGALA